ncbi:hypothetical protein CR513_61351, partial [Mucuna pruriens]
MDDLRARVSKDKLKHYTDPKEKPLLRCLYPLTTNCTSILEKACHAKLLCLTLLVKIALVVDPTTIHILEVEVETLRRVGGEKRQKGSKFHGDENTNRSREIDGYLVLANLLETGHSKVHN